MHSIHANNKWRFWLVNIALILTAIGLYFGLSLPLITLQQLYFFKTTFSIISGVATLYHEKQILLFILILSFSIVIPIVKLIIAAISWNLPSNNQLPHKLLALSTRLGRWSMLDVFAIAIFVVLMKTRLIAQVQTHPGLMVFCLAVLSLMLLTSYVNHHLRSLKTPLIQTNPPEAKK